LSIDDFCSQGQGVVQCRYFLDEERWVLQSWMSALFGAKILEFWKIYGGFAAQTMGVELV